MTDAMYQLLFRIQRSIRYHRRREAFLENMLCSLRLCSLVSLSLGVAVTHVGFSYDQVIPYVYPVLVGTLLPLAIEVIFSIQPTLAAQRKLATEFIELQQKITSASPLWEETQLEEQILEIEKKEFPIYRALDVLCHNEMVISQGFGNLHKVTLFQRLMANFLHFNADSPSSFPALK